MGKTTKLLMTLMVVVQEAHMAILSNLANSAASPIRKKVFTDSEAIDGDAKVSEGFIDSSIIVRRGKSKTNAEIDAEGNIAPSAATGNEQASTAMPGSSKSSPIRKRFVSGSVASDGDVKVADGLEESALILHGATKKENLEIDSDRDGELSADNKDEEAFRQTGQGEPKKGETEDIQVSSGKPDMEASLGDSENVEEAQREVREKGAKVAGELMLQTDPDPRIKCAFLRMTVPDKALMVPFAVYLEQAGCLTAACLSIGSLVSQLQQPGKSIAALGLSAYSNWTRASRALNTLTRAPDIYTLDQVPGVSHKDLYISYIDQVVQMAENLSQDDHLTYQDTIDIKKSCAQWANVTVGAASKFETAIAWIRAGGDLEDPFKVLTSDWLRFVQGLVPEKTGYEVGPGDLGYVDADAVGKLGEASVEW